MKREHSYIIGALALAGAILLAEADTVKNGFVEVVGEGARANGDRDVVLHEPEDPSEVKVSTQAGWRFTDPQDAAFLHHVGATDLIHLVNESKESEATIKITDDWEHTCEKTNWEEHVSAPKLVVGGADHALILLKPDDVGVFLETNCTASAGEDGIHNVWTECKPCRHPDCRGRNPLKWVEEKKIHAPDQVEGEIRASGKILVDPDRDDGYYLLEGPHELLYTASFDLEECEEHLCVGGAVTNTTWDVCRLSVTNTPYLGIDLTDEGKKTNAVGFAEARYGYRPKNTAASYYWEFISPRHGVIASQDDEKGTARLESARPAEPSDTYQGDQVICHATLTETNPPDGHNPCVASADVTSPVTVVRVDVVMDDVEEDKEETEGAMLYYIPDAENGEWTEEGTNELRKIRFVCEPDEGEMLKHEIAVTAPEGLLFEKVGKEYQPAKETYTVEELNKKEFRVHGHRRSEKYLGDEIEAIHLLSGAKDKVKLTIFGRPLLVPDYDRNGNIDEADDARAQDGKTIFRFWINDDDDRDNGDATFYGLWGIGFHMGGIGAYDNENTNIPGGGSNHTSGRVNGLIDLEDFTPVKIDLSQVVPKQWDFHIREKIQWKVKSSCTGIVWTDLYPTTAGDFRIKAKETFGPKLDEDSYEAPVDYPGRQGMLIPETMMKYITAHDDIGICLMEGVATGTDLEIVAEYEGRREPIAKGKVKLSIDSVEKMYRWLDLRHNLGNAAAEPTGSNFKGEPANAPDAECNGIPRKPRNCLYIHGFNVNQQQARGWASTIFKRFWQSGYNDLFTAVDWYGDIGQGGLTGKDSDSMDYYSAVINAFRTSKHLAEEEKSLPGEKWIFAHSLGNVVASAAIEDWDLQYTKYYLVNAAVPMQAYEPDAMHELMTDKDWWGVKTSYRACGWYKLFGRTDFRSTLHWVDRFPKVAQKMINCYSGTDDVVGNDVTSKLGYSIPGSVWTVQERFKGRLALAAFDAVTPNTKATREAGWGVNPKYILREYISAYGSSVNDLPKEEVIKEPLFAPFVHEKEDLTSLKPFPLAKRGDAHQYDLRATLLADGIPATSFAAGANRINDGDINLEEEEAKEWPRKNKQWLHSDIKNVAYYYVYKFFDNVVKGEKE